MGVRVSGVCPRFGCQPPHRHTGFFYCGKMTKSDIQSVLGAKTVSYNSLFAKAIRNVPAAVFLSQAIFWQEKAKFKNALDTVEIDSEVYFAKTGAEWFDETGLTSEQQKTARKYLCGATILKEKLAGVPAKMYFRIDIDALVSGISAYLNTGVPVSGISANRLTEIPRTSTGHFRKQADGFPGNINIEESFDSFESKKESAPANAPLSPPFKKVYEIYPETFGAEKENPTPQVAPPPPPQAGAVRISLLDPELPGVRIEEEIRPKPQMPPEKTGRTRAGRYSQTQDEIGLVERVISHLNQKAGRSFRVGAGENAKGIVARYREGFTEEEMIKVVDFKVSRWATDAQMCEHLNPVTLFRPSHFENYLQAAKAQTNKSPQFQPGRSKILPLGSPDRQFDEVQKF